MFSRVPSPDVCGPGSFPGHVSRDIFSDADSDATSETFPRHVFGDVFRAPFRRRFRTRGFRQRFRGRLTESCFVRGFRDVFQIRFFRRRFCQNRFLDAFEACTDTFFSDVSPETFPYAFSRYGLQIHFLRYFSAVAGIARREKWVGLGRGRTGWLDGLVTQEGFPRIL